MDSRHIGQLEGRLTALEQQHRDLKEQQKDLANRIDSELAEIKESLKTETREIKASLGDIQDILQQFSGAKKVFIGGAAVLAAFGGFVSWALGLWNIGG